MSRSLVMTTARRDLLLGTALKLLRRRVMLEVQGLPLNTEIVENLLATPYHRRILDDAYMIAPNMVRQENSASFCIAGERDVYIHLSFPRPLFATQPTAYYNTNFATFHARNENPSLPRVDTIQLREWAMGFNARVRVMDKAMRYITALVSCCRRTPNLVASWPRVAAVAGARRDVLPELKGLQRELNDVPRMGLAKHLPSFASTPEHKAKIAALDHLFAEAMVLPEEGRKVTLDDGLVVGTADCAPEPSPPE